MEACAGIFPLGFLARCTLTINKVCDKLWVHKIGMP